MESSSSLPAGAVWFVVALGALVLVGIVVLVVARRDVTSAAPSGAAQRLPADLPPEITPDMPLARQVAVLLRRGDKIEAIKAVREQTGLGLKDAKDVVEAIEAGRPLPPGLEAASGAPAASPETDTEVRALLARGQKIDAIKLVRERTGMGLADAKAYVEGL